MKPRRDHGGPLGSAVVLVAARDRSVPLVAGATLALLLLTTGPLYRVRTWWSYDNPLATDAVIVAVHAVAGAAAAVWLIRRRSGPPSVTLILAAVVAVWLTVGTLWSTAWATTLRESLQIASALTVGAAAVTALGARWFAGALWTALHIGLVWSFAAVQLGQPGTQDDRGYWAGVFFNRNSLGLMAALGLVVSTAVLLDVRNRRRRSIPLAAGVAVAMVIDLRLLVGSAARTPWVALAGAGLAVAAVVAARSWTGGRRRSGRAVAAGGGLVVAAAGLVAWLTRHEWIDRLGRESDLTGRVEVWDVAVERWRDRPGFGHGYLAAWEDPSFVAEVEAASGHVLTSAHNAFVEMLLGGGAVGLVLFSVWVGVLWIMIVGAALERPTLVTLSTVAVLVFVLTENLTETLFVGNHLTVALFGAVAVQSGARPRSVS